MLALAQPFQGAQGLGVILAEQGLQALAQGQLDRGFGFGLGFDDKGQAVQNGGCWLALLLALHQGLGAGVKALQGLAQFFEDA